MRHRLRVAGVSAEIFTPARAAGECTASPAACRASINVVCDRALLGAYTRDQHRVGARLVREAAREVFDENSVMRWTLPAAAALVVALVAGAWLVAPRLVAQLHRPPGATAPPAAALAAPAVASAPVATPAPPTLAARLASAGDAAGNDAAFSQLLGLWHAKYTPGDIDGCTQARSQGLECLDMRASLAELRELNRPAILLLTDRAGANRQVVVTGMGNESVTLMIGDRPATAGISELAGLWYGDLVTVWRPGGALAGDLHVGLRAPAVRRVRAKLRALGVQSGTGTLSDLYDAALARQVGEFQRRHHLDSDGIAGPETLMLLDSQLPDPGTPVLRPPTPGYAATAATPQKG